MLEKKTVWRQWTLILIFCVDVHMGLDPLPPSTCVHLSRTPLRVAGWPLSNLTLYSVYGLFRLTAMHFSNVLEWRLCWRQLYPSTMDLLSRCPFIQPSYRLYFQARLEWVCGWDVALRRFSGLLALNKNIFVVSGVPSILADLTRRSGHHGPSSRSRPN